MAVQKSMRFLDALSPRTYRPVGELLQALGQPQPDGPRAQRSQQRAAQRQLGVLVELGLAESTDPKPGLPTCYRLSGKAKQLGLARYVTVQEWAVLQMAANQLRSLLPVELEKALSDALQRLAPGIEGGEDHERARAWGRKTGFVPNALVLRPPRMPSGVMVRCFEALWHDRPLSFHYTKPNGATSRPEVQALAVVQQGSSHVLVARRLSDGETRHYVLHRMRDARITSELPMDYPADFDLQRDVLQGKFGFGEGSQVAVHFEIEETSGSHLRETPLSSDQQVTDLDDGWLRIEATVPDNLWFWDWLRGFGTRVRLIAPADRVRHLRRYPRATPL